MKFLKISTRDTANKEAVDPLKFDSEHLLKPHIVNNIHIIVKNMYYAGYKDLQSISEQLKHRNIEMTAEVKKSIQDVLNQLEESKEKSAPTFKD